MLYHVTVARYGAELVYVVYIGHGAWTLQDSPRKLVDLLRVQTSNNSSSSSSCVRAVLHQCTMTCRFECLSDADLDSCVVVVLLYLWVSWLIGVDIDFSTGNSFGQAFTQQQRHQCYRANSLQHNSLSFTEVKQQHHT